MTTSTPASPPDVETLREQLAEHGFIALLWGVDDVKALRDDLTEEQAWDVLNAIENNFDASVGVNWDTLHAELDHQFPPPSRAGGA